MQQQLKFENLNLRNCFKWAGKEYCRELFLTREGNLVLTVSPVRTQQGQAVYAFVRRGDEVLMVKKAGSNFYDLPGGAVKEHEHNLFDAMKREWKEEMLPKSASESDTIADFPFSGSPTNAYTHECNYMKRTPGKEVERLFLRTYRQNFQRYEWPEQLNAHPLYSQKEWETKEGKAEWVSIDRLPETVNRSHWPAIKQMQFVPELSKRHISEARPSVLVL
ncbi:MAG: NUDIX domain-containing protein [Alphaproteobacteria bacterium]|nr:NUDIX domain-containing protein [Alphaproteobacteria bacterium]